MANAAVSIAGMPMYAGQGWSGISPVSGLPIGGTQASTNAARIRMKTGRVGSRVFAGGRGSRALDALSFLGGQINPFGSSQAMMKEWDFHNENVFKDVRASSDKKFAGAKYDKKTGKWIGTKQVAVSNPNKVTGAKRMLGRGKALGKGGLSMGGMAAGMAISALANSGMAPSFMKENAGAINMGAGLMAINPMLGLGAMGAGTLFNLAQGKGARTAGGGALTGAASGAAVGAAVGSFLPGIGTATGALVGTVIGGVVGFFGGKKAERMAAKEAAKSASAKNLGKVVANFIAGNGAGAKGVAGEMLANASKFNKMSIAQQDSYISGLEKKGVITKTQAERARQQRGTFGSELTNIATDTQVVTKSLTASFENLMNGLQGSTGMARDEILELAKSMGVNLYDPTLKLTDAISGLGKQMDLTAKGLAASGTDAILRANRVFDEMFKEEEIRGAMDAAGRGIAQAGGGSRNDYIDLMQKTSEYLANQNPNDPLGQLYAFQSMYGEGGKVFTGNGQLANVGRENFIKNAGPEYQKLVGAQASNLATERSRALTQLMNEGGVEFTNGAAGFAGLKSQLEAMYTSTDPATQAKARELENLLLSGQGLGSNAAEITKTLTDAGFDLSAGGKLKESTAGTLTEQLTKQQAALKADIVAAIGTGFNKKPNWWDGTPTWWNSNPPGPDTSSPRASTVGDTVSSRLGRTMARHNYFNSSLTGKRTITSAWRNYALGSPSSDHVTGNAYDLTGQNLGQYATTINKAGGFAEFHGSAGSRHLHVVPPSSPVGDTGTSRIGYVAPAANQQPSGGAVTINVYASEGQSEQEIARMVMNEISKAQRNWKERR
jgi:hypothetical protein